MKHLALTISLFMALNIIFVASYTQASAQSIPATADSPAEVTVHPTAEALDPINPDDYGDTPTWKPAQKPYTCSPTTPLKDKVTTPEGVDLIDEYVKKENDLGLEKIGEPMGEHCKTFCWENECKAPGEEEALQCTDPKGCTTVDENGEVNVTYPEEVAPATDDPNNPYYVKPATDNTNDPDYVQPAPAIEDPAPVTKPGAAPAVYCSGGAADCKSDATTKDGDKEYLAAAEPKPPDRSLVPSGRGGSLVKNPNVDTKSVTPEEFKQKLEEAGVKVEDNSHKSNPGGKNAMQAWMWHGDALNGKNLSNYCTNQNNSGGYCTQAILHEDGRLELIAPLDSKAKHAKSLNNLGPGVEIAGINNHGDNATPAQLETIKKMNKVMLDDFGWSVGTHGQAEPGHKLAGEGGDNVVAATYGDAAKLPGATVPKPTVPTAPGTRSIPSSPVKKALDLGFGAMQQATGLGNTGANSLNPLGMLANLGNSLGSFMGGGGVTKPSANTSSGGPLGMLSSLFGGNSNNTNNSSSNPQQTSAIANAQLDSLLDRQSREQKQTTWSVENVLQVINLLERHKNELTQFGQQYPAADQNYIRSHQRLLDQTLVELRKLQQELQSDQDNTTEAQLQQQINDLMRSIKELESTGAGAAQTNTSVKSDLTVVALKADGTITDEYRFRGSLSRTLVNDTDHLAFSEVGSYFGNDVKHELLIDLQCDGSVDQTVSFNTPYYSILPRADGADVLLSEYAPITATGLHCFAFKVDTSNVIPEINEKNNQSEWREFIAGFGTGGSGDALPPLNFEISAYTSDYGTLTQDWTSEDIVISPGNQIAFRWDAPQYQQCIPLLSSLTADVAGNLTPIERNTISESVDLHEHTGYYELRCSIDGNTRVETVYVEVKG